MAIRFVTSILRASPILAVLVGGALLAPRTAQATPLIIHMVEQGGNVVATGSGSIDLTGLTGPNSQQYYAQVGGSGNFVFVGDWSTMVEYVGTFTGPSSFGSGGDMLADGGGNGSGDPIGIWEPNGSLYVPSGYASDSPLSGSATWTGATFASLGITPGTYTWTWGAGPDQSFTLEIGGTLLSVPEPASLGLFGLGMLMLGGFATLRRRDHLPA